MPEANAALGVIYLRQGKLAEAEAALRAELARNPGDLQSQQNLAVVLDSQQRPEEAIPLLRGVLQAKPDFTDARYLLGKILLAQGDDRGGRGAPGGGGPAGPRGCQHPLPARAGLPEARADRASQQEFDLFREIKAHSDARRRRNWPAHRGPDRTPERNRMTACAEETRVNADRFSATGLLLGGLLLGPAR